MSPRGCGSGFLQTFPEPRAAWRLALCFRCLGLEIKRGLESVAKASGLYSLEKLLDVGMRLRIAGLNRVAEALAAAAKEVKTRNTEAPAEGVHVLGERVGC